MDGFCKGITITSLHTAIFKQSTYEVFYHTIVLYLDTCRVSVLRSPFDEKTRE